MILTKIKEFVKTYQADIILVIGVILVSLLSFALGFIVAKQQEKEQIKIEFSPVEQIRLASQLLDFLKENPVEVVLLD